MRTQSSISSLNVKLRYGQDKIGLADIRNIQIDNSLPVAERLTRFTENVGNPYFFKVGNTPVQVEYSDQAPPLQEKLFALLTKWN